MPWLKSVRGGEKERGGGEGRGGREGGKKERKKKINFELNNADRRRSAAQILVRGREEGRGISIFAFSGGSENFNNYFP